MLWCGGVSFTAYMAVAARSTTRALCAGMS